ncbi:putative sulfate exporter family transporter [Marinobacteraceae bacterium S3BR75-40.1]
MNEPLPIPLTEGQAPPKQRTTHVWKRGLFGMGALACLTPWLTAPVALALGMVLALGPGHPYGRFSRRAAKCLLQVAVVGLGLTMDLASILAPGLRGLVMAAAGIAAIWLAGSLLGRWLGLGRKTTQLVCAGTAICGGSAIAALGSVLDADENEMSVALGAVFVLNALALFLFPLVGHSLGLDQVQFGTWAGLAIHDVSSVVAAGADYGPEALQTATAVKLSRSLWILPVCLVAALSQGRTHSDRKGTVQVPWFIALFVLASLARTLFPALAELTPLVHQAATQLMTLALFLVGAGLARRTLRQVGARPLLMATLLWLGAGGGTLWVIGSLP